MKYNILAIAAITSLSLFSCKKTYLDTKPSASVSGNELFESTAKAKIALNGLHSLMLTDKLFGDVHSNFGAKAWDLQSDLMGNDMVNNSGGPSYDWFAQYYSYTSPQNPTNNGYNMWLFYYRIVNNANAIINNIDKATGSDAEKNNIKGQAIAYRAWAYLGLVTRFSKSFAYGANANELGVPIYKTVTSGTDQGNPRGKIIDVVNFMKDDIATAITLLETGTVEVDKANISVSVANGIAARISVYAGEWENALKYANAAKGGYSFMSSSDFGSGLNKRTNNEFMWCSTYSDQQYNDLGIVCFMSFFDETAAGGYAAYTNQVDRKISKDLLSKLEATDYRRTWWNPTTYIQRKFRVADPNGFVADLTYMRVAEMYLIAAEAAARLDRISESQGYLTALLASRNVSTTGLPSDKAGLIDRILLERRIELWGEGFAYTDIKHRNLPLSRPSGTGNHQLAIAQFLDLEAGHRYLTFKIPLAELNANTSMNKDTDQNP